MTADQIVVYEAVAASTRPLRKKGSIYHEATMTAELLEAAAAAVNSGDRAVPLHTEHRQGEEAPIGRVFRAKTEKDYEGHTLLKAMFYLPATEADLISKIDTAVYDEVSVGLQSTELKCSKCDFDYFAEGDLFAFYERTCANGHTVGVDGTHVKMNGLDAWMELSLVSRGASYKPKILSQPRAALGDEEYERLAANGLPLEATLLFASFGENSMDKEAIEAAMKAQQDALTASLTEALAPLAEALAAVQAQLTASQVAPEAEEAKAGDEPKAETEGQVDADAASGEDEGEGEGDPAPKADDAEEPAGEEKADEVAELKAQLSALTSELTELKASKTVAPESIPTGGASLSATSSASPKIDLSASAYRTLKR